MRFAGTACSFSILSIGFDEEVTRMCELFGYFGDDERDISADLREFFSHSVEHPQGWGLALGSQGNTLNIEKESLRAIDSSYLKSRLDGSVSAKVAIAHIRLATAGNTSFDNCHPFSAVDVSGRQWTLAHNGTILAFDELERYRGEQRGSTDSERILCYLIDKVNEATRAIGHTLDVDERFRVVERIVAELSANNNKVNLLIHDGEQLLAHCNFANSLHARRDAAGTYFSTHALSRGTWRQLPLNTLVAFRRGDVARIGHKHANESFQTAATIEAWQRANGEVQTGTQIA